MAMAAISYHAASYSHFFIENGMKKDHASCHTTVVNRLKKQLICENMLKINWIYKDQVSNILTFTLTCSERFWKNFFQIKILNPP